MIIAVNFPTLKQLERGSLKKSGLQRDSNPRSPRYRCDALPTELWSHTLGARSLQFLLYFHLHPQYIYELFHIYYTSFHSSQEIWTRLIDLAPNVWLPSSVGRALHSGIAEVTGLNPVTLKPWFFQASSFQLLKLENLLRKLWSFFTFN